MILAKLIRYTNAPALEATWVDEAGQVVKCQAYANNQMDLLAADLGDDAAQHQALLDEVAATYVEPEPVPPAVPASVTMRQARLALLGAGKLAAVAAALDSLPEPARSAATIEWEYSNEVLRHNGFVAALGPALGFTEPQLDALFIRAATL